MVAAISSVKIRSICHRHLRNQDQDRGRRHFLSQDQIHRLRAPMQPRSRSWQQTFLQSRSDPLVVGTYVAMIKIVVADVSSVKIKSIGHRHVRSQDQDRGCRRFLSQDHINWSQAPTQPRSRSWPQTFPQSRSDPLVVGAYVAKIKIMVADTTFVKIKSFGRRHYLYQDQVLWSQTLPSSRSGSQIVPSSRSRLKSPLVVDNSIIKIKIYKPLGRINC